MIKKTKGEFEYFVVLITSLITFSILITVSILMHNLIMSIISTIILCLTVLIQQIHNSNQVDKITETINFSRLNRLATRHIQKKPGPFSCIIIDIERFSAINDNYGREKGDSVMFSVAEAIKHNISVDDLFSRNESKFVIFRSFKNENELSDFILKIKRNVFNKKYDLFTINSKIVSFTDNNKTKTFNDLYKNAELKLRQKKGLKQMSLIDINLENIIRKSIKENGRDFFLCYQPKVDIRNGEIVGVEALIRLKNTDKIVYEKQSEIYPDQFLSVVEKLDLMPEITEIVLEKVCLDIIELQKKKVKIVNHFAVNITPPEFKPDLVEKINKVVDKYNIDHSLIQIEITEGSLIDDLDLIKSTLESLKKSGYSLAVDDFGTGNTCFKNLKELVNLIDIIKIDKYFVETKKELDKDYLKIFMNLANTNNASIVFEGVETIEQYEYLKTLKIKEKAIVQGYLISKPLIKDTLIQYIECYNPNKPY